LKVYFRTDASHTIGFGHLVRCISLAKSLRKADFSLQIYFIIKYPDSAKDLLSRANFHYETISDDEDEFIFLKRFFLLNERTIIIFDNLTDYPPDLMKTLSERHTTVMVHPYSSSRFFASIAIYPVGHLDENVLLGFKESRSKTKILLGMQYCLLNDEVLSLEPNKTFPFPPTIISIIAGGSDPSNTLDLIYQWLLNANLKEYQFRILFGKASVFASKNISILAKNQIQFLPFSMEEIQKSDVVISAFGVTIYELVYLRKPVISYGHTVQHAEASERFSARHRCTKNIGNIFELNQEDFIQQIDSLLKSREQLSDLFQNTMGLVDSYGTDRVSKTILETYYEDKRI